MAVEGYDIEAAGPQPMLRVTQKKIFSGADQAPLLAHGDAGRRTALAIVGALTYFHKDQRLAIEEDDIYFPHPAAIVARQGGQSVDGEQRHRAVFTLLSDLLTW